jgi:hypothetical protein
MILVTPLVTVGLVHPLKNVTPDTKVNMNKSLQFWRIQVINFVLFLVQEFACLKASIRAKKYGNSLFKNSI